MTDLIRLAERVKALTGHSAEVDIAIYKLIDEQKAAPGTITEYMIDHDGYARWRCKHPPQHFGSWWCCPAYTESLDAAMTLVPDAKRPDGSTQISFPRVMRSTPDTWEAHIGYANSAKGVNAIAATPALALTAAALRSLAAQRGRV